MIDAADPTSFITVTEVDSGQPFVGALFQRKFAAEPPDSGRHLVSFYRERSGRFTPLSYIHFRPFGDIFLVGGASTDGAVFALMQEHERDAIRAAGGVYLMALVYGFTKYAGLCDAFFGHCADARAYAVDIAAGFVQTEHQHLIVRWNRPLEDRHQRALIAKAHAIGAF